MLNKNIIKEDSLHNEENYKEELEEAIKSLE